MLASRTDQQKRFVSGFLTSCATDGAKFENSYNLALKRAEPPSTRQIFNLTGFGALCRRPHSVVFCPNASFFAC